MRIGILGCGYVGQAAARHWKSNNDYVSVTTRQPERIFSLRELADQVFLLNSESFPDFLSKQEALLVSVAPDASSTYVKTYLETAQLIAKEAVKQKTLRHIIYTGSLSVYGDQQGRWINEETPPAPGNENAKILLETEQTLLACSSLELKVCIFRLGEIYGPGREIENRLKRTGRLPFPGTGSAYTNIIHLTDIVKALDFAIKHQLQGIFNLCSDFHMTRSQFYQELCQKENLPPIEWDPSLRSQHGGNRRASNLKIKNEGFVFAHPLYT